MPRILLAANVLPQLVAGQHAVAIAILLLERLVVSAPLAARHTAVAVAIEAVETRVGVAAAIRLREHAVAVAIELLERPRVSAPLVARDHPVIVRVELAQLAAPVRIARERL